VEDPGPSEKLIFLSKGVLSPLGKEERTDPRSEGMGSDPNAQALRRFLKGKSGSERIGRGKEKARV
jgi:hypothetical protein